ncbi:MAG: tetratricopeptide repeat protein [Gammaproteobacteria bacterium]|nr:MAG: tetratricopeptide repeat protein [Gammaproteobacteria bacterium]
MTRFVTHVKLIASVSVLLLLINACAPVPGKKVAEKSQDKQIIIVDDDVRDDFEQALAFLKKEEYDQAIELLNRVIKNETRLPAPYVNLGMAYIKKGDNKQAEQYLHQALALDLAHPVANNELGLLYRKVGRFDDARKAYTNALTEHPDYLPVRKNLAILCDIYLRDLPCALEQYEQYLEYAPEDQNVPIWIADLKRRMGQ